MPQPRTKQSKSKEAFFWAKYNLQPQPPHNTRAHLNSGDYDKLSGIFKVYNHTLSELLKM